MYNGLVDTLSQKEKSINIQRIKNSVICLCTDFFYLAGMYITEIMCSQVRPLEIY